MADLALRHAENVNGNFFVDTTCIDCDACRQIAPSTFRDIGEQSAVYRQPESESEILDAQKALISCPTSSIGMAQKLDMSEALLAYPERIAGDVYRCGFTSESSFGAFSYFVTRGFGNVLIDSPRYSGPLVKRLAAMGGVKEMLLTHRDDVADHERFHQRFGCDRLLHQADLHPGIKGIERHPSGMEVTEVSPGIRMIPTPGHTRGHVVFLCDDQFLFTGDHLAWDAPRQRLYAFRGACWYSWEEQIASMTRLLDFSFEWVLPGHGRPIHLPAEAMHEELERCVAWMKTR